MSYTALAVSGMLLAICCDMAILRTRLVVRRGFWCSYAIMLGFQLLVNGVLTGCKVVRYNPADIIGVRVAYAPIEDIGFGFTMILLTLSCWVALNRRS